MPVLEDYRGSDSHMQMPPRIAIDRSVQQERFCNPPMEMEPFRYTVDLPGAFAGTLFGKRHGLS